MRTPLTQRILAVSAAALVGAALTAPAATALTTSPTFPETLFETKQVLNAISPYGPWSTCTSYRGGTGMCWQQRPDGQWVELKLVGPLAVYPVWEDPASLVPHRDAVRAATPEPLRSNIPAPVWDLLPR